jgi:TctA family transporter
VVGNLMLLVINLPLIGMWVKLLQVPYKFLYPAILVFCCIGAYSVNNNVFDVYSTRCSRGGLHVQQLKMEPRRC